MRALAVVAALAVPARAWAAEPSAEAASLAEDAERARAAGLWDTCMVKDQASLALEDKTTTRVHLVGCADRAGKVLVALAEVQKVLDKALQDHDAEVAKLAQSRAEQLLRRLATVTIEPSAEGKDLKVTVDDVAIAPERFGKPIRIDPGKHRVHAAGLLEGAQATFDDTEILGEGEQSKVIVALRPNASEYLTPGQLACMQLAKTQQEVLECLPGTSKPLVVRTALEASGYMDTFSVWVMNPLVRATVTSPTHGWSVGAQLQVDMITAASPDFVSTASPRGKDTRYAAAVNGGYKPGAYGFDAQAAYSTEADYTSRSVGVGLLGDIIDKRVTPRLGYDYSNDTISRGGTPTSVFASTFITHEATASVSVVASPTTVFLVGVTAARERGDQSKPYRLIPMFAEGVSVPAGASTDEVNAKRLPVRPYEQLPLARDRWALGARVAHRFTPSSTLRLEERLYADTWENRASTTDLRILQDLGDRFTFGPHARFNVQTGANFFQRVYHADTSPVVVVPVYRTTDRELGPLWAVTGGGAFWWKLGDPHASPVFTLYFSADALWSHYTDDVYVSERFAGYGTIGLEAQFE